MLTVDHRFALSKPALPSALTIAHTRVQIFGASSNVEFGSSDQNAKLPALIIAESLR
jgi:hypothetical protein